MMLGLVLAATLSCGSRRHPAAEAAEGYYAHLVEGRYEEFLNGIAYADSMTDTYRAQMVDLLIEYAEREREQHGGIVSARALTDTVSGDAATVFMEVLFADSVREEISLPMVLCDGTWKMK